MPFGDEPHKGDFVAYLDRISSQGTVAAQPLTTPAERDQPAAAPGHVPASGWGRRATPAPAPVPRRPAFEDDDDDDITPLKARLQPKGGPIRLVPLLVAIALAVALYNVASDAFEYWRITGDLPIGQVFASAVLLIILRQILRRPRSHAE